jgi:dihydrofolate synthase/folylpolyglutamate synthase
MQLEGLSKPAIVGDRQLDNAAAVLALLEALGRTELLEHAVVDEAMRAVFLQGRFQVLGGRWILDVAHNEAAGRALDMQLGTLGFDRLIAVVGMLADKDVSGFLGTFAHRVDEWIAAPIAGTRGQSSFDTAKAIANVLDRPCLVADSVTEALEAANDRVREGDMILVTGSFHVVGPALEWLDSN